MASQYPPSALRHYQTNGAVAEAAFASPHKLIDLLLVGALDRLASARGHMARREVEQKLRHVSAVVAIVEHLRMTLDIEAGGQVAQNLSALYDYILRRVMQANLDNEPAGLDEAADLLRTLKSGWDALPEASQTRH